MSSLLGHCHGENWKSPTRSFERSGKAKRTFEERKKNNLHRIHNAQLPHKLNRHLPNSQPFQTAKLLVFQILFWQTLHTIHLHSHLGWCKTGATPRHQSLKIYPPC